MHTFTYNVFIHAHHGLLYVWLVMCVHIVTAHHVHDMFMHAIYIYVYICIHIYIYIFKNIYICIFNSLHIYIHNIYMYMNTCSHTVECTPSSVHAHTCACVCHQHIHTHITYERASIHAMDIYMQCVFVSK